MRYKRGHCGIFPKNCHVALSLLAVQTTSLATCGIAHSTRTGNSHSFHPDISHPDPANVLLSPDISQPQFYPTDVPPSPDIHIRRLTPDGRGGRFNFPGQTCPDPSITVIRIASVANDSHSTRIAWLVRYSRFAGSISAHNQKANSDNTAKPSLGGGK